MPDKKISDLALTAAVNTDDTFEKSKHNAAPSERMTVAQLVTFLQTALASLQTSNGKITLNVDGSASFANGLALVDLAGNILLGGGGQSQILANGSASFASGATVVDATGAIGVGNNATTLAIDGSASFANGKATFTFGGAMTLGAIGADGIVTIQNAALDAVFVLNAALGLFQGGTLPSFSLNAGDGSASFANGSTTIDAAGNLGIGGTQVVTSQQPAVADATGAGDVVTQLNLLLAALRVHGLIAP